MTLNEINEGLQLTQLAKEAWESRASGILQGVEKELVRWAKAFLKQRTSRPDDSFAQDKAESA